MLKRAFSELRRSLLAGLATVVPFLVTAWVLWILWDLVSQLRQTLQRLLQFELWTGYTVPGLELVFALLIVIGIGAFTRNLIGRRMVRVYERLLARVPLVSSVYGAVKQLSVALLGQRTEDFRGVVMVEYPRRGVWVIGFQTGTSPLGGEVDLINVFVPTTPNPTSGFYILVEPADLRELDLSIEEASKLIMSAGIVAPDRPLLAP